MKEENLLFIISQPRAGSTMLQAILSNVEKVNTTSEHWMLLPFLSLFKPSMIKATYNYDIATDAFFNFLEKNNSVHNFKSDYKKFILNQYSKTQTSDNNIVIDKTPRYYEIFDVIYDLFPKAKFILLKRHPVAVLNSIMKTWDRYSFKKLSHHHIQDIFKAPFLLDRWTKKYNKATNVKILKYEKIIENPDKEIENIFNWLELDYYPDVLNYSTNHSFQGKYGDPKGVHLNKKPSNNSVDQWINGLSNKRLKDYLHGYGAFLGDDFLSKFGYSSDIRFRPNLKFNLFNYYCQRKNMIENKNQIKDAAISFLIRKYLGENI